VRPPARGVGRAQRGVDVAAHGARQPVEPGAPRAIGNRGRERAQREPEIGDEFELRAMDAVLVGRPADLGGVGARVPGLGPGVAHLDGIVAETQDEVRGVERLEQRPIGDRREPGTSDHERIVLGHQTLGLVGRDDRRASAPRERGQLGMSAVVEDAETGQDQRALGTRQPAHERVELRARGEGRRRPARQVAGRRLHDRAGHTHRDVQMDGPGHAARGERDRAVDERARAALPEREAAFGDRREQGPLVEDLMRVGRRGARVEGGGEHDHGRAVEIGVGDGRHQVGDTRPDRADQDARRSRELRHRVGHEAARRLVLDQVKRDAGARERVHDGQHLAAGDAEGVPGSGLADPLRDVIGDGRHEGRSPQSKKWAVKPLLYLGTLVACVGRALEPVPRAGAYSP
jgi:hypothetical protein